MLSKTSRVIQSEAKNLTECSAESLHERSAEALSSGEINLMVLKHALRRN